MAIPNNSITSSNLDNLASVITPAYNCKHHIELALKCVAQQTISVLEHIVIDDGSTDGTLERLYELSADYPHLKIISQSNQGAGPARNAGILQARGRYIVFLDSDDVWLPEKLEYQIRFMEVHNVGFSYGDYKTIDSSTGICLAEYDLPSRLDYHTLLKGCPIGCLTAAYNQEVFGKQYMPNIRRGQDWALWLTLTKNRPPAHKYPGSLASYTYQVNSLSKNKLKKVIDIYSIYTKQEKINPIKALWFLSQHIKYATTKIKQHVHVAPYTKKQ